MRPVRIAAGGIGTDGPEDRGLSERCIIGFNAGPPFVPSLYNNNVQIFQSKDTAVLMTEMIHDARIVPLYESLDDLPPLNDDVRLWTGTQRLLGSGHFGSGYAQFQWIVGKLWPGHLSISVTERFTRVDEITVDYEFTVEDPATFSDRFTGIVSMTKVGGLLYEYACHEGNYGMVNILRGARVQERMDASGS